MIVKINLIRSSCADASNKKRGKFLLAFPFGGERENRLVARRTLRPADFFMNSSLESIRQLGYPSSVP